MTPAEAIDTAELAEAGIRYRHQVAREMAAAAYGRGQMVGTSGLSPMSRPSSMASSWTCSWRPGAGDPAPGPLGDRARATSLAQREAELEAKIA